jgi:hypothetical protein
VNSSTRFGFSALVQYAGERLNGTATGLNQYKANASGSGAKIQP